MFIIKTTTIYSLEHGLHTLTAVPGSTQPSTLRGMVKWVSAFGVSNDNKHLVIVGVASGSLQADSQPGSFGLVWGSAVASRHAIFIIWTGWTLTVALSYNDSTINVVVVIIIILLWQSGGTLSSFSALTRNFSACKSSATTISRSSLSGTGLTQSNIGNIDRWNGNGVCLCYVWNADVCSDESEEHERRVSFYQLHYVVRTEAATDWTSGQFLLLWSYFFWASA